MARQSKRPIVTALNALAFGVFGAFVVAISVFADGLWTERRFLILAILASYGLLGFLAGWLSTLWSSGLWLSFPALPALLLFGESTTLGLGYFGLIGGCATFGAGVGALARLRRRRNRS